MYSKTSDPAGEDRWPIIELPLDMPVDRYPRICFRVEECEVFDWVLAETMPKWQLLKGAQLLSVGRELPRVFRPTRCIEKDGTIYPIWLRSS